MKKSEIVQWLLDVLKLNVKVSIGMAFIGVVVLVMMLMCRIETMAWGLLIEVGLVTMVTVFGLSSIASGVVYDYLRGKLSAIERREEKDAKKRK